MPFNQYNCALGACCAEIKAQKAAVAEGLLADGCCDPATAATAASWILDTFDLATKGSLTQFKADLVRLAREPQA